MIAIAFLCISLVTSVCLTTQGISRTISTLDYTTDYCHPTLFPNLDSYVPRTNPFGFVCCVSECSHFVGGHSIQLNTCAFFRECYCHPSGKDENCDYIFRGVLHGFKIVDDNCVIPAYVRSNYTSITSGAFQSSMQATVDRELSEQKIAYSSTVPRCVHSIGGIPKKDGSLRPITDCKRPLGHSINNFMFTTARDFHYKNLDLVATILSQGDYLSVVDIASAYRTVHIFPGHCQYQGFEWRGSYYVDNRLSFGLKCAPYIFTSISDFIVRTMGRYGYRVCINYIDDFLCHGGTLQACLDCQEFLIKLLHYNFHLVAKRISSHDNILPDCLSRVSNKNAFDVCIRLLMQGRYNFSFG